MNHKNAVRFLAVALFATLMAVPMWAQVADVNTITCVSSTGCKINHIPLYASTGGPATVRSSIMTQGSGAIHVAGGLDVTGSVAANGSVAALGNVTANGDVDAGGNANVTGSVNAAGSGGVNAN